LKKFKKILIIGGTGFIGYHLAKRCLEKNWHVTSLSTKKPKKIRFLKKVNYLYCDISKYNLLKKKLNLHYNYVVNLGGYVDHSNKKKVYLSHYLGVKNLAKFFLNSKIENFIQFGSGGEYGNLKPPHKEKSEKKPKSSYYNAKFMATKYLVNLYKKNSFPVTIFRLYQAYGPRQDPNRLIPIVIMNCLKNKTFDCTDGKQFRDFIYVEDVINAVVACFENKLSIGEIFNIGTNKPIKIKKLIIYINRLIKKGKPLFGKISLRKDEQLRFYPSIFKISKILNWKPKILLNKGINRTIKFYKSHEQNN
jgi:nucleoside-diphosphate-sugar epimerase